MDTILELSNSHIIRYMSNFSDRGFYGKFCSHADVFAESVSFSIFRVLPEAEEIFGNNIAWVYGIFVFKYEYPYLGRWYFLRFYLNSC